MALVKNYYCLQFGFTAVEKPNCDQFGFAKQICRKKYIEKRVAKLIKNDPDPQVRPLNSGQFGPNDSVKIFFDSCKIINKYICSFN